MLTRVHAASKLPNEFGIIQDIDFFTLINAKLKQCHFASRKIRPEPHEKEDVTQLLHAKAEGPLTGAQIDTTPIIARVTDRLDQRSRRPGRIGRDCVNGCAGRDAEDVGKLR